MKKILFVLCVFGVSFQSYSAPGGWAPTYQNISEIIIEGNELDGKAFIVIEGGVPSDYIPPECNSPYNTVNLTSEKGRGILSLALAAYMGGKPVRVALSCAGSRPLVTNIRM